MSAEDSAGMSVPVDDVPARPSSPTASSQNDPDFQQDRLFKMRNPDAEARVAAALAAEESDFDPIPHYDEDVETVDLTNERLDDIGDLSKCKKVKELFLRCNLVRNVNLHRFKDLSSLELLDLYENRLTPLHMPSNMKRPNPLAFTDGMTREHFAGDSDKSEVIAAMEELREKESSEPAGRPFANLKNLIELDLSFNELRFTSNLEGPEKLETLYLIENKITEIGDLSHFAPTLKLLELGSNRIRVIRNLTPLHALEQLFLGRNKITKIQGLEGLTSLRVLHLQANRITEVGDSLKDLVNLEELYLGHNGITKMEGFNHLKKLHMLDFAGNRITVLEGFEGLDALTDIWMNNNQIADLSALPLLRTLPALETIYLEQNPCAQAPTYRREVIAALPQIIQLDADEVKR